MELIKVGIIEDDTVIRHSLTKSIELYPSLSLSYAAGSVEEGLDIISDYSFGGVDVILLDIGLPGLTGIEGLPIIKHKLPNVDVIMLTTYDDSERIFHCLCNGAQSYISKKTSLKVIMDAVHTVYRGGSYMSPSIARKLINHIGIKEKTRFIDRLTDRQTDIIKALSEGLSYKLIAAQLEISIDTVRSHIKKIYKVLEVNSKVEAINIYRKEKA